MQVGIILSPLCEFKKIFQKPEVLDNIPKSHRHQTEELEIKLVSSIFESCHAVLHYSKQITL